MSLAIKFAVVLLWSMQICDVSGSCESICNNNERPPRVQTFQTLSTPLTNQLCKRRLFKTLRACTTSSSFQREIGRRFLCPSRDSYTGNDLPTNRNRVKRAATNPCSGNRIRVAVLVAVDQNGIERELVVDRANFLYQTIIIQECGVLGVNSLPCQPHNITFEAAVFSTDPNSNDVSIEDVSVQAYCALSLP